jgi:hypothetical protein
MAHLSHLMVDVIFDPNAPDHKVSFGGRGITAQGEIFVPQGMGLVVFNLQQSAADGGEPARFPSSPIQWIDAERAVIQQPAVFTVRRLSDQNTTLQVVNSVLEDESHRFFVLVQHGSQFYGADPTVITQRPGGGLPGGHG